LQDAAGIGWQQVERGIVGRVGEAGQKIAVSELLDRHQCDLKLVAQVRAHRGGEVAGKALVQLADAVELLLAQHSRMMQVPALQPGPADFLGLDPGSVTGGAK
jgi:hypothetical protein